MENIKLSVDRQVQIKALWDKFIIETTSANKTAYKREIEKLITEWDEY